MNCQYSLKIPALTLRPLRDLCDLRGKKKGKIFYDIGGDGQGAYDRSDNKHYYLARHALSMYTLTIH